MKLQGAACTVVRNLCIFLFTLQTVILETQILNRWKLKKRRRDSFKKEVWTILKVHRSWQCKLGMKRIRNIKKVYPLLVRLISVLPRLQVQYVWSLPCAQSQLAWTGLARLKEKNWMPKKGKFSLQGVQGKKENFGHWAAGQWDPE